MSVTDPYNFPVLSGKERRSQIGVFHWEREDVLMLIRLHSEKEPIFNKPGIRKKDVWAIIADEFHAKGFNVTSGQCEQKWKNITKNYRDTVDHNYFSTTYKECPFFKELAAIYPYNAKEKQPGLPPFMNAPNNVTQLKSNPSDLQKYSSILSSISSANTTAATTPPTPTTSNSLLEDLPQNVCITDPQNASIDSLVQNSSIKHEILDDDDDEPTIILESQTASILPTSPLLAPTKISNFQLPQSQSNSQISNSILSTSVMMCKEPSPNHTSPMAVYSTSPLSTDCIRLPSQLQQTFQQIRHPQPEVSSTSRHSLPMVHSSSSSQHHSSGMPSASINSPSSLMRKRLRDKLAHSNNSFVGHSSNSDFISQRRRFLRRTNLMPNNTLDMLKQMNDERRREHKELIDTLKQQHTEYLQQEEMNQSLLSTLIEQFSKR